MLPAHEHGTECGPRPRQQRRRGQPAPSRSAARAPSWPVGDESNITRAAARLGLTHPAVSRTLAALERHPGIRLVDRSTHHLAQTPEDVAFRDRAAAVVAAFDAATDTEGLRGRPPAAGTHPARVRPVHHRSSSVSRSEWGLAEGVAVGSR